MLKSVERQTTEAVQVIAKLISGVGEHKQDPQALAILTAGILIAAQLENIASSVSK